MHFYNDWALRILKGQWTDYQAFYGLPLYAYLLAGLYKLFGYTPFVPGFIQAGLDAGTAVLIYKLATKIFGVSAVEEEKAFRGRTAIGVGAALGWGVFQPAEAYSIILMPTSLLVFVFWLVVWQIVKRETSPCYLAVFFLGALIGFTSMAVATILFLTPLLLVAILFKWQHRLIAPDKIAAKLVAIVTLASGIGFGSSPAWLHNYFVAHDHVFLTAHSGVNFWIGNNPLANGYPKFPPGLHASQDGMLKDSVTQAEAAAGRPLKRSEVSAFWSNKAWSYIHQHPFDWLMLVGRKLQNFWNAYQYDDLSIVTTLRDEGVIFPGLRFGIVAALALPGVFLGYRRARLSRWVAGAIALHMLALLPVFVTERYRLPAVPGLLLFASYGLYEFWSSWTLTNYRRAFTYGISLLLAIWLVATPQRNSELWALDNYNTGLQALQSDHLALAQQKLAKAYAYVPENAEINFAFGNLRVAQGNPAAARPFYFATLRLDPGHEGAYNNLGVLELQEKQWALAEKLFRQAVIQNPKDSTARYLLARSLINQGDFTAGEAELKLAQTINPGRREFTELQQQIDTQRRR